MSLEQCVGWPIIAKPWGPVDVQVKLQASSQQGARSRLLGLRTTLPFLPRAEDMIDCGPQGDYVQVDLVFWSAEDGFTVWLADDEGAGKLERYLAAGWSETT